MQRQEIIGALQQLTDKQFVELFYEAVHGRHVYLSERRAFDAHLVLANAVRDVGSDDKASWTLEVVCPTPERQFTDDSALCQAGEHCGHSTVSWAKVSQCPVCGGDVYGT